MPTWATPVFAGGFEAARARLTPVPRGLVTEKITEMGRRLGTFPHDRMKGRGEYRLRVGDDRVIYRFDTARNEIQRITLGHRREVDR